MKIQDFFKKKEIIDENSSAIIKSHQHSSITEKEILNIPAVSQSLDLITSIFDTSFYQVNKNNEFISNDFTSKLNNDVDFSNNLKKVLIDVVIHGTGYLYNDHGKLVHLAAKNMTINEFTDNNITVASREYEYNPFGIGTENIDSSKLLVFDSHKNGVLIDNDEAFESILMMQNSLDYQNLNMVKPNGVLSTSSKLSGEAITRLSETFKKMYSGVKNSGKTVILEQGLEYKQINQTSNTGSNENQKKDAIGEIARIFNIPESLLNSSIAKYGSIIAERISLIQSLQPYVKLFETVLSRHYVTTLKMDVNTLILSEPNQKADTSIKLLNAGVISNTEARQMNNFEVSDSISEYFVNSIGKVLLPVDENGINKESLIYLNVPKTQEKETQQIQNNEEMEQEKL